MRRKEEGGQSSLLDSPIHTFHLGISGCLLLPVNLGDVVLTEHIAAWTKMWGKCVWGIELPFSQKTCHSFLDNPSFNQYLYVIGKRGSKNRCSVSYGGLLNTRGFY